MPAHRKSPGGRQDNRAHRALMPVPDMTSVTAMVPDPEWPETTTAAWAAFWDDPDIPKALGSAQLPALRRLFAMYARQEAAWKLYDAEPFVDGSKGQPVISPGFDAAMSLERTIQPLEERFGMTPKAKAQLGIAFGQASLTAAELNKLAKGDDDDFLEIVDEEAASG